MRYPVLLSRVMVVALLWSLGCIVGCGAAQVERCQLDALRILPDDPLQVTPYDAVDLVNRIHACKEPSAPTPSPLLVTDAGW